MFTEIELLYDSGKLFVEHPEEPLHFSGLKQNSDPTISGCSLTSEQSLGEVGVVDDYNDAEEVEDNDEDDISVHITRTVDSMCDCLSDTFRSSPFVLDNFISLSNLFFQPDQLSTPGDHAVDIIKSKVIAQFLMKTFISADCRKAKLTQ